MLKGKPYSTQLKTDWFETFQVYFSPLVDAIIDNKRRYTII